MLPSCIRGSQDSTRPGVAGNASLGAEGARDPGQTFQQNLADSVVPARSAVQHQLPVIISLFQ